MGIGKSAYEKNGRPNYIKLSEAEYKMIKNIWVDIENDPQFHGYSFFISFCDVYPQYIKFYTLDAHLSLTYDTRTTAKFTIIMETLGYLILDFYNKPKQQDRLIGYIAMVHKDMRLDKRDIFNFGSHLLEYLTKTFPAKMTVSCKKILTKYFNNILDRIITKVEYFQNYEQEEADSERSLYRLLCSRYAFSGDKLVYGQSRHYWKDRKKQWDMRLDKWMTNGFIALESAMGSSTDEEDISIHRVKTDNGKSVIMEPQRQSTVTSIFAKLPTRDLSDPSASRLALLTLSKRLESRGTDLSMWGGSGSLPDVKKDEKSISPAASFCISEEKASTSRERYRARNLARDASNPRNEATVLRKRVRSSRIVITPRLSCIWPVDEVNDSDPQREKQMRRFNNTARERRRDTQHFSFDLK